jgi:ATP-binding cassette subfamily B protein
VDSATEERMLSGIRKAAVDKTVIIVAHRLLSVRSADKIVVLDAGRVVEEGQFEELAAANGPFAQLLDRETAQLG